MKIKSLCMLTLGFAMSMALAGCGGGGGETPTNNTLFGKSFFFNGFHGNIVVTDGEEQTLDDILTYFYGGDSTTQFTYSVADDLIDYFANGNMRLPTPDKKLTFSTIKSSERRKIGGGETIETYIVNPVGDECLCEFAPIEGEANKYRMYDVDDLNFCHDHIATSKESFGATASLLVYTKDIEYNPVTNMVKINTLLTGYITYPQEEGDPITKDMEATFDLTFGDGPADGVRITAQPKDITVDYPNAVDLTFSVAHEEKVLSYKWYCGAYSPTGDCSYGPLNGTDTEKRSLHLDGIGCMQTRIPFKCLIKTEDREFYTSVVDVFVNKTDVFVPTAFICDTPIRAGETLDLSTTPYGSGTISYHENGHDFTFTNVLFNNEHPKSDREATAFSIQTFYNPHEEYNFNFVGENVFNNSYWEEDSNQGGITFFLHFGRHEEDEDVKIPTINFKGDPVTFIGGTNAVWTNGYVNIYNDINIVGLPKRLTKGIVAGEINVKKDATISGVIGGSLLFSEKYGITIEEGTSVNAIINCASVSVGDTNQFGISANGDLKIKKSNVNIIFNLDLNLFVPQEQFVCPLTGLRSATGTTTINESVVNIKSNVIKEPKSDIKYFVDGALGINSKYIDIISSKVYIDMCSLTFHNVTGINTTDLFVENSQLDINVKGYVCVSGIVSGLVLKDPDQPGRVDFRSSQVNVKTYAHEIDKEESGKCYYIDAGIRAVDFFFDLDKDSFINVETNQASAFVSAFDNSYDKPVPTEGYIPKHIVFNGLTVTSDPYVINLTSYDSFEPQQSGQGTVMIPIFVVCEAMFTDSTYQTPLTKAKLTSAV